MGNSLGLDKMYWTTGWWLFSTSQTISANPSDHRVRWRAAWTMEAGLSSENGANSE